MFACLAAATVALTGLRPTPPSLIVTHSRVQRSTILVAQLAQGWIAGIDQASGATYYYNEQTGVSQWEPPVGLQGTKVQAPGFRGTLDQGLVIESAKAATAHQGYNAHQGYDAQQVPGSGRFLLRLVPVVGAHSPIRRGGAANLCSGDEQIIGRFDMVQQDVYVSRAQCKLQVAADGTAFLTSLGKPPTLVRGNEGGPWYGLGKDETHVLTDGTEICLTGKSPNILASQAVQQDVFFDSQWPPAVFMCQCQGGTTNMDVSNNNVQYSEDGCWMWNGTEWVPAALSDPAVAAW